ncbi:MAG: DUF1552 domain-containing protein [Planctomycetaceae bacterium]|nr:DUF1552 domain-containing protein [Planctomycetaceae bacterium]
MHHKTGRRSALNAAGVCLALPMLESLPLFSAADGSERGTVSAPRRMVCVGNEFGMYPGAFWPKSFGSDYEMTELLQPLEPHRGDFTLFSHLDHGLKGGHFAVHTFLTGVNAADAKGMAEGGISLDQRAAEHVGAATRFPSLAVGSDDGLHGGCQMSWTRTGTRVPPVPGPRELFRLLFVADDASAKRKAEERIQLQSSILDAVLGHAESLKRRLSHADQQKLDEYFASIRDVEVKLALDRQWQNVAKPQPPVDEPQNQGLTRDLPAIYDLIALALQTDSTRVATLEIGGTFLASDLGVRQGYHSLSHHGQDTQNIKLLVQLEKYQTEQLSRFLGRLKEIREPGADGTLLDRTMVLMGSGMGNANSHTNTDLPVILAGGGFRHGSYLESPAENRQRVPLSNLFLSMLQQFGVETEFFSMSTGTLTGLETIG